MTRGDRMYGGEPVTQLEHALQSAALAIDDDAPPELVVAALLHDIGHLLDQRSDDEQRRDIDLRHECLGADWLTRWFPASITEPVRQHVLAKRYRAGNADYVASLSEESRRTLQVQGGELTPEQRRRFEDLPYAADAIALRRWDDAAKVAGAMVPPIEAYIALVRRLTRRY